MLSTSERLRSVRRLHRRRAAAAGMRDVAFALYVTGFITIMVGVPLVVVLVRALRHPAVLDVLESAATGQAVALLGGFGLVAVAGFGAIRGPVTLSPFLAHLLALTDMARRRTLLRPLLIPTGLLIGVLTAASVILSGVLVHAGIATFSAAAWFSLAAASYGVLLGIAWLGGQVLGPARPWRLPGLILAAVVITWLLPPLALLSPWGWLGLLWPTNSASMWWPCVLLMFSAICTLGWTPRLLDALAGPTLQAQASRWQAAGAAASTADFAGALDLYRAPPRVGRSWHAVGGASPIVRFFIRDLIGAARTPGRLAIGTAGLIGAGWLSSVSFTQSEQAWLPGVVGAGLGYAAAGVLADGFRHASEAASAPALYGHSTAGLFWLHSIFPALWTLTWMLLGVLLAWPVAPELGSLIGTAALSALIVVARAYDCAKGFIPPHLMNPAPSPAGDLSGLLVLTWQCDAPLIVTLTAVVALSALGGSSALIWLVYLLVASAILARTRGRIRSLEF